MKIKTANLIGHALDWAVAKCEGHSTEPVERWKGLAVPRMEYVHPAYSTNLAQGHAIIEHQKIGTRYFEHLKLWEAESITPFARNYGPTALIAAMRCYVASKLGDEIDVPEELL